MLRLVKALGTDHGKSVLLSTHLLADVEAVCERVVILAGGRVRGLGTVAELCARRQDRFRLRVQGDGVIALREELVRSGTCVRGEGRKRQGELEKHPADEQAAEAWRGALHGKG